MLTFKQPESFIFFIRRSGWFIDSWQFSSISAGLGWATQIIPRSLTFYISTALFALFGLKMLHEGYHMSPNDGQEEYEEAQAEVHKKQLLRDTERVSEMESGSTPENKKYLHLFFSLNY